MNYFIDGTITKKEIIRGFNEDISIFSYKIFRSKPDIMLFEQLAASFKNNYGLEPFQVLYIGNDMLNDIYTASQMNFKTALYAGDKQSLQMHSDDERCKNCKPGFIITELKQVLSILGIK